MTRAELLRMFLGPPEQWPLPAELLYLVFSFANILRIGRRSCYWTVFSVPRGKRILTKWPESSQPGTDT